jgi:hypothetical protein
VRVPQLVRRESAPHSRCSRSLVPLCSDPGRRARFSSCGTANDAEQPADR